MSNILTIDVEDWYQTSGLDIPVEEWAQYEDRVYGNTLNILDLLDEHRVQGTFFVLACVADKHPSLVREIHRRGHAIGSHGGMHRMVNRMTLEEFRDDVRHSKAVLEDVTGAPVAYFRAPSWSISADKYEALCILEDEGFVCDSSLQPFRTPLSGSAKIPVYPFHPVVDGRKLNLVELPATVLNLGPIRIPFSGGFYLRFWPKWLLRWAFRQVHKKKRAGMIYTHPWEIDTGFPKLSLPPHVRWAQYYRLCTTESKLDGLLRAFSYISMDRFLQDGTFPEYSLRSADK